VSSCLGVDFFHDFSRDSTWPCLFLGKPCQGLKTRSLFCKNFPLIAHVLKKVFLLSIYTLIHKIFSYNILNSSLWTLIFTYILYMKTSADPFIKKFLFKRPLFSRTDYYYSYVVYYVRSRIFYIDKVPQLFTVRL
jgi:hypothetical protein